MTDIQRRRFLTAGVLAAAGARSIGAEAQLARTERMEAPSSPAAPTNEPKKKLWMLLASQKNAQLHLVAPTIAWIADQAGVAFENYFEAHGNGDLFGSSTVVGGHHHQQFNYLNTLFDIDYILLGPVNVFRSSIEVFRRPVLVESDNLLTIYDSLLAAAGIRKVEGALFATTKPVTLAKHKPESGVLFKRPDNRPQGEVPLNDPLYRSLAQVAPPSKGEVELQPYLYPDIYFGKLLGLPADSAAECPALFQKYGIAKTTSLYLRPEEKEKVVAHFPNVTEEDTIRDDDTHASISLRRANRWKSQAKGVVWADSAMMASLYARVCREKRVPFFEREFDNHPAIGSFRGRMSHAIDAASKFACELGNKVIVGRGVWDGDIIWMSQSGCCIQIMDPRRPVFPILETVYHPWTKTGRSVFDDEPSDGQLERWASEGKVLTSLIWHSGEVAHNEGVVNLLDLAAFRGLKMGIGVHLARVPDDAPVLGTDQHSAGAGRRQGLHRAGASLRRHGRHGGTLLSGGGPPEPYSDLACRHSADYRRRGRSEGILRLPGYELRLYHTRPAQMGCGRRQRIGILHFVRPVRQESCPLPKGPVHGDQPDVGKGQG